MPRVTLTFELPAEEHELLAALRGDEAERVLREIDCYCRAELQCSEQAPEAEQLARIIRMMIPAEYGDT